MFGKKMSQKNLLASVKKSGPVRRATLMFNIPKGKGDDAIFEDKIPKHLENKLEMDKEKIQQRGLI